MKDQDYKQTLEDAVLILHKAEIEIFTAMVNVAFSGKYKDISKVHDEGEIINMELDYFENSEDANIDILLEVVKNISMQKIL
jgi:hypothetical protein